MKEAGYIGVVGTGMIGSSLAALFTGNGYKTVMLGINEEERCQGENRYDACFRDLAGRGLITDRQVKTCKAMLKTTCEYQDLSGVEFVFECVLEQTAVKHEVYRKLESYCKRLKAIASSTSAICADELADGLDNKGLLAVAHPWNPPHLCPCVEVVKSKHTSQSSLEVILNILKDCGKETVVLEKGIPGFIGNRLQYAMYREAVYLVEQGAATPEDIDRTLKYSFAPRYTSIGIFEHFDNCGLDLAEQIEDYLFPSLCGGRKASPLVRRHCHDGEFGIKSGQGMLCWEGRDLEEFRRLAAEPYFSFFNWNLPAEEGEER